MAITAEYQEYLSSEQWKEKRMKVLNRAKFRCEKCRKKQAREIHHLTYERIFDERLSDLQALCPECHKKVHKTKSRKKMLNRIGRVLARVI